MFILYITWLDLIQYIIWNIINSYLFIWLDLIQCKTVENGRIFQLKMIKNISIRN